MTLALESIAFPQRNYVLANSQPVGSVTGGSPLNRGKMAYDVDTLGDVRSRRTDRCVILEEMGAVLLYCQFFDPNNSTVLRRIHFNNDAWIASTDYLTGAYVVSDGKLWECTTGGTSGSTAPNGTSETLTFTDGSVEWVQRFGPLAEGGPVAAAQSQTIYRVSAWDIDLGAWVDEYYPESELTAAISYDTWLELDDNDSRQADPTTVLPRATVQHIDMDSPPPGVGDLAKIHELTGGL